MSELEYTIAAWGIIIMALLSVAIWIKCQWGNKYGGCEYGQLVGRFEVDEMDYDFLLAFMQKINADEMVVDGFTFQRGQLLLVNVTVERPPVGKVTVVLTFNVHSGKWTSAPKMMVPRWPAWRGYKFKKVKGAAMLEHVRMFDLIEVLENNKKLQ